MNKTAVLAFLNQQYEARIQRIVDIRYNTPDFEAEPAKKLLHDRLFGEAKQLLKDMDRVKAMSAREFAMIYGG